MSTLSKILVLILSIGLVACSTNTQKENTGIGAVTGAVVGGLAGSAFGGGTGKVVAVGVGAVAGALIGGYIGHSMDSTDSVKMNSAMNNPTNQTTHWKNKKTGARYSMTPTSNRMTVNGNPNCRKYHSTAVINGEKHRVYGVACLQSDGTWKAVNAS